MIAGMAIAFTACKQDSDVPVSAVDDRPLTVTAAMPISAWGVESRADGFITDLAFHYYAADGEENAAPQSLEVDNTVEDESISFTTNVENQRLLWSKIKKENNQATFFLTATKDGVEYWATKTVTPGEAVTFGEMKPRKSKFTINLKVKSNLSSIVGSDFAFALSGVKNAATATVVTTQAWPCEENSSGTEYEFTDISVSDKTVSATALFAPQNVGNLTVSYKSKVVATITLADVAVSKDVTKRTEKANVLKAGEHIIVSACLNLMGLTPSITVEGFTADSGSHEFNGTVTTNP